jgi:retron-type reverse transcriptase
MRRVSAWRNLLVAAARARRGKRKRPNVAAFEFNQEGELLTLQRELQAGRYQPGPFRTFTLFEPKRREISVAPYRDRVVHHAVCNLLTPLFEPTFVHESFACRVGKGTHAAVDLAERELRRFPFVLKADIARFFPTIDHDILLSKLRRKLKDPELLNLLELLVRHPFPAQQPGPIFPGDHLFTRLERTCGLPIGNQTSQFFGNVMLNALDHFVKEQLRACGYVRYVDDFLVFGHSAVELHAMCEAIRDFLRVERLRLNPQKTVVSRSVDGVRFLGYRLTPRGRSLPRETRVRFRRRLRRWQQAYARGAMTQAQIGQRLAGWLGHAQHAQCEPWLSRLLDTHPFERHWGTAALPANPADFEQAEPETPD